MLKYCEKLLIYFVFILFLSYKGLGFGIELEGVIDLGPQWSYIYKLSPINDKIRNKTTFSNKQKIDDYIEDVNNILRTKNEDDSDIEYAFSKDGFGTLEDQHYDIDEKFQEKNSNNNETFDTIEQSKENNNWKQNKKSNSKKKNKSQPKRKGKNGSHLKSKKKDNKQHLRETINDYKVKDNQKVYEFALHVFKQSLISFDSIKKLTENVNIKKRINTLKQDYIEKFGDFLKKNGDYKLKTKLAEQNVVLNTIDKSNKLLLRLSNHLDDKSTDIEKIFRREIKKLKHVELLHACKKLNICRGNYDYNDFLVKLISIILEGNDAKIKQAADALTETVKSTDFTDIIEYQTQDELNKLMKKIETWDPFMLRAMFLVLKRVIVAKNEPRSLMSLPDVILVNRTISFQEFLDILNKKIATPENKKEWREMIKKMEDWRDDKSKDIQNVFEKIIKQIKHELEKLDYEVRKQVSEIMKILLSSIKPMFGIKIDM